MSANNARVGALDRMIAADAVSSAIGSAWGAGLAAQDAASEQPYRGLGTGGGLDTEGLLARLAYSIDSRADDIDRKCPCRPCCRI